MARYLHLRLQIAVARARRRPTVRLAGSLAALLWAIRGLTVPALVALAVVLAAATSSPPPPASADFHAQVIHHG